MWQLGGNADSLAPPELLESESVILHVDPPTVPGGLSQGCDAAEPGCNAPTAHQSTFGILTACKSLFNPENTL